MAVASPAAAGWKRREKSASPPDAIVVGKTTPMEVKAALPEVRAKPFTTSGSAPTLKTLAVSVTEEPALTRPKARLEITATRAVGDVVSSKTLRPLVPTRSSDGVRVQSRASAMQLAVGRPTPSTCQVAPESMLRNTVASLAAISAKGASPKLWSVQVSPSGEVTMVPPYPTATNRLPFHTTSSKACGAAALFSVQVTPSGEL